MFKNLGDTLATVRKILRWLLRTGCFCVRTDLHFAFVTQQQYPFEAGKQVNSA